MTLFINSTLVDGHHKSYGFNNIIINLINEPNKIDPNKIDDKPIKPIKTVKPDKIIPAGNINPHTNIVNVKPNIPSSCDSSCYSEETSSTFFTET